VLLYLDLSLSCSYPCTCCLLLTYALVPQAVLTGPDVNIQMPKSEDLRERLLPDADLVDKKSGPVNVFGGQSLTWSLTLTNTSNQPMASCQILVSSQKAVTRSITRGALLNKPSGGLQGGTNTGAHMEVKQSNMAAQLPLQPGRSLTLPVALTIGRSSSDNYEPVTLEMQISYSSTPGGFRRRSSEDDSSPVRRELVIPIRFVIQPTLQVTHLKFLQHLVPMMGSVPVPGRQALNLQDAGLSNEGGVAGGGGYGWGGAGDFSGGGFGDGYGASKGFGSPRGGSGFGGGGAGATGKRWTSLSIPRNSSEGSLVPSGVVGGVAPLPPVARHAGPASFGVDAQQPPLSPGRVSGGSGGGAGVASPPKQSAAEVLAAILAAQQGTPPGADSTGEPSATDAAAQGNGSWTTRHGGSSATDAHGLSMTSKGSGAGVGGPGSPFSKNGQQITAAKPPAAGAPLRTASEVVLEVGVRNTSERYFRTWVAKLGSSGPVTADSAESAVVVLGPGDTARLLCALPKDGDSKGPSGDGGGHSQQQQQHEVKLWADPPPKVKCGEVLTQSLGVMWEMITGDVVTDKLPRGQVALNAVDAARSMNASESRVS
jgi:hypothetical protein